MANQQYDEKEQEKREEKEEEKSWDEKYRRDPVSAVVWAAILIWAGLVFLADNLQLLPVEGLDAWSLVFIGAGGILFLEVVVRLAMPDYRRSVMGTLIFGFILLAIGLGDIVSWGAIWPLVLVAIGVSMLLRGIIGGR